jgi:hypothetical protein
MEGSDSELSSFFLVLPVGIKFLFIKESISLSLLKKNLEWKRGASYAWKAYKYHNHSDQKPYIQLYPTQKKKMVSHF